MVWMFHIFNFTLKQFSACLFLILILYLIYNLSSNQIKAFAIHNANPFFHHISNQNEILSMHARCSKYIPRKYFKQTNSHFDRCMRWQTPLFRCDNSHLEQELQRRWSRKLWMAREMEMEFELETYVRVLSKQRRCESRSFSQPIYLAKRWGLYLPPSLYSLPSPSPAANVSRAPTPCGKEIRTSCELDLCYTRLMKIFTHTRTNTHTHASGYTFRRLSLEYGNFAIYLINFCLFHIERDEKGTKESCPTISYATHIAIANGIAI